MFSYLYEWIMNIAFYMVMVTAVLHVVPNSDYKRYIRFFTGMVLAVMLTDPFLRIFGVGNLWQNLYKSPEYQKQVEKMEEAAQYLNGTGDVTKEELEDIRQGQEDGTIAGDGVSIGVDEIKIGR
jgi:stage III sporulation protein AF